MGYMISHFKGRYKLLAPIDTNTNNFCKTIDGRNEEIDVYIPCKNGGQISYYGKSILEFYMPSIKRGKSIIKEIYYMYINPSNCIEINESGEILENGHLQNAVFIGSVKDKKVYERDISLNNNIIFDVRIYDKEVLFRFKYADHEKIFPILKPLTSSPNRSPFSTKNLPKSDYVIPEEDLNMFKNIIQKYSDLSPILIAHTTNNYIKTFASKRNPIEKIKADMKKKCLKGKDYIHYIGKWNGYLLFLDKYLNEKMKEVNKIDC